MMEPKPFASLSSGLLARKGTAKPAMRPQGLGQFGGGIEDLGWNDMGYAPPTPEPQPVYEEEEVERAPSPISALTPMGGSADLEDEEFEPGPPIVEQQRAAIEASFAEAAEEEFEEDEEDRIVLAVKTPRNVADAEEQPETVEPEPAAIINLPRKPARKAGRSARSKAAFTLRLEAERHLKLRLACAVTGQSAQQFVTEALDRLLETQPEIGAMADRLPAKSAKPR